MRVADSSTLAGRRILVIEDEYLLADDMGQALAQLGAEVIGPVPSLKRAVEILDADRPIDAAVLDIDLRSQASFPIADMLMARGVPFVFASGYGRAALPSRYEDTPLWVKPFDPDRLARTLPDLLHTERA